MVDFGGHYYHAMDREYEDKKGIIGVGELGISANPMTSQLEGLKAKIFQGAKKVELGFSGAGKGSMQGQRTTPEMYGKDEREAIRELSKINEVDLSTHGSFSIGSLAGFNPQAGRFDEEQRKNALFEIQRTVEFAADTARGGAIVVHAQEFPRSMAEEFGPDFRAYPDEPEKAKIHLVNTETGQIQVLSKDMEIALPVTEKDPATGEEHPVFDSESGTFKVMRRKWDYFVKKSEEWNKANPDKQKLPQEVLYDEFVGSEIKQAEALARYHSKAYDEELKTKEKIEKAIKFAQKIESETDPAERWRLQQQISTELTQFGVTPDLKMPAEFLKERLKMLDRSLKQQEGAAISYLEQAEMKKMQRERIKPLKEWAVEKTADTVAEGAMYAFQLELDAASKGKPFRKPLFIAPENLFPEDYGSHPSEMREVILKSRDAMAKKLQQQGYDAQKAGQIAKDHIKATLDTGHAYMWKKFFQAKPGQTPEDVEKSFNKWVVDQIGSLAKEGIIGNVHLHDNFGYYDEHVTPGQGKVPLKEIMQRLTEAGVKDIIVEPAHQDYKSLLGAWKEFGHNIYGMSRPGMPFDSWVDVENRYFGRNAPPYFVVGDFRPSEEWSLWSQTPLE